MVKFSGPIICFVLLSMSALNVNAQNGRGNDSAYYVYFPNSITGRIYTSQKYSRFNLKAKKCAWLGLFTQHHFQFGCRRHVP